MAEKLAMMNTAAYFAECKGHAKLKAFRRLLSRKGAKGHQPATSANANPSQVAHASLPSARICWRQRRRRAGQEHPMLAQGWQEAYPTLLLANCG